MARDDYHVIVYQILSYLYMQLKQGKDIDASLIRHDSKYLQINSKYWTYVIVNLLNEGYISGIVIDQEIYERLERHTTVRISRLYLVGFYFAQFQERRTIWLKD